MKSDEQLLERLATDLCLAGKAERTVEAYTGAVRRLARWTDKPLGAIEESDVRAYLLGMIKRRVACDRLVPLPAATLQMLRDHWRTHCSPIWLFPARTRKGLKHHLTAIGKPPCPPETDTGAVHDTQPRCPNCGAPYENPPERIPRARVTHLSRDFERGYSPTSRASRILSSAHRRPDSPL